MAVLKIACPRCGQRVSGDESFYGTSVDCPVCSSSILFPDKPVPPRNKRDLPKAETSESEDAGENFSIENESDQRPQEETTSIPLDPMPAIESAGIRNQEISPMNAEEVPSPLLGILSMVAGILNVFTGCLLSLLLAPAAIICGHLALAKARYSPIQPAPGRGMAIAGIILGYLGMLALLISLILIATGVIELPFGDSAESDIPAIE